MPSPFPGMDPYLEEPAIWPNVHHGLISEMQASLNRSLSRDYVAVVEERVYIADDHVEAVRVPDVRITDRPGRTPKRPRKRSVNGRAMPVSVPILIDLETREARIEIRDSRGDKIITVIEVLSPSNKRPGSEGFVSFKEKRDEVLHSTAHWVEVDLLRDGRPTIRSPRAKSHYRVVVSPAKMRPNGHLWALDVRDPLPTIGIPLRRENEQVALDLQSVLNEAYDRGAFDRRIDYQADPVPPLERSDAAWADRILHKKGLRK